MLLERDMNQFIASDVFQNRFQVPKPKFYAEGEANKHLLTLAKLANRND